MTALPPPPLPLNRVQQMQFGMMAELLPVRPYPLDMTTWVTRGHGRILTRMAGELPGLRSTWPGSCPRSAGWSTGWPRCGCDRPGGRSPRRSGWPGWRGASPAGQWTEDPRFAEFERGLDRLRRVEVGALTWPELLARVDEAFAVLDGFITLRVDYLPDVGVSLARLRLLLAVLGLTGSYGGLMAGVHTRTGDANRALRELAGLVDDPETFEPALRRYADEYGHREVTSAFVVSEPTWGEDLSLIREAAQGMAAHPAPVPAERSADAELAAVAGPPSGAAAADRAADRRRRPRPPGAAWPSGRTPTSTPAALLPIVRGALLEAGERLARAGVLDDPAAVWHLRWSELTGIARSGRGAGGPTQPAARGWWPNGRPDGRRTPGRR